MQDAVVLAKCIYDLSSLSAESIRIALQEFKDQRYPRVKEQYGLSKVNAIYLHGQVRKLFVVAREKSPGCFADF